MLQNPFTRLLHAGMYLLVIAGAISSCRPIQKISTDYTYFGEGADTLKSSQQETIIRAGDLLAIQIYSRSVNQEQAAIFNIPVNNQAAGPAKPGYLVSPEGTIDMAVIGAVKAAGLSKKQLENLLTQKLTEYVKSPSVLINLMQFNVNVLGEVKLPGIQRFDADRVTIIDALAAAGDLTDFGKREDITVIREEDGKKIHYSVDLRKKSLFSSPAYILQPNDIVYVRPNNVKLKNLTADPEKQRRTSQAVSIIGVAVSVATLVILSVKK